MNSGSVSSLRQHLDREDESSQLSQPLLPKPARRSRAFAHFRARIKTHWQGVFPATTTQMHQDSSLDIDATKTPVKFYKNPIICATDVTPKMSGARKVAAARGTSGHPSGCLGSVWGGSALCNVQPPPSAVSRRQWSARNFPGVMPVNLLKCRVKALWSQ